MSKYQLEDLLNEITGTGRIGTYLNTYRGLLDKVDQIEDKGIRVKKLGMSGDGKVPFEFEIYPGDKDEAFSVYPYKFDPADEDDMQELPFSIGGKPVAIRAAKELLGQGAMSNAEVRDAKDELKSTGDEIPAGFEENVNEEEAIGQLYVQPAIKKEIKRQLDAYNAGDIDVNDLIQGIEDIIFGRVPAPGMEESVEGDKLEAGVEGDRVEENKMSNIDLAAVTKNKYNNAITTVADFADALLDIWGELSDKENEALFQNSALKNAKRFLTRASSEDSDGFEITEASDNPEVDALLNKIRKHLENKFKDRYRKFEYDLYIDSLERDIKRGDFDGVESLTMEEHEEDFVTYISEKSELEENKSLKEHFKRFI